MPEIIRTNITPRNNQPRRKFRPRVYVRPVVALPWTADEEAIFLSFERTHIPGAPWPIKAMDFFSRKQDLDCRQWTQESLDPKILEEREKAQKETGVKKVWDPNYLSVSRKERAQVSSPLTADEKALYREFEAWHVPGTHWPINDMNQVALARGLDCRKWTPRALVLISREERERRAWEAEVNMAQELAAEEPADEDCESSEGERSGNGGGSERGWISGEDESRVKRSHSI
jgi:hypothetical protein